MIMVFRGLGQYQAQTIIRFRDFYISILKIRVKWRTKAASFWVLVRAICTFIDLVNLEFAQDLMSPSFT
ncbi:MAG TPA: hypothetical protein [Caudoviricetes sp.]|nr:MAG TPA: hypothetical protein [Caudoviricetes sp.]